MNQSGRSHAYVVPLKTQNKLSAAANLLFRSLSATVRQFTSLRRNSDCNYYTFFL